MKTLLQLEQTFFDLAASCRRNTLVISDRGAMDPSSCKFHKQSYLNSYMAGLKCRSQVRLRVRSQVTHKNNRTLDKTVLD